MQQVGCQPNKVDAVLAHLERKWLLEPVSEEVAKETMATEAVVELCILQEQKMLACLEMSRPIETCNDKASKPFEGLSKGSKRQAKKRSQQTKTEMVFSVGSHDITEVVVDMSTWMVDGVRFGHYWARLKELSAKNDAARDAFEQFCEEDTGNGGLWHNPCLFT